MYTKQVHALLEQGVVIPRPEAVEVAPDVRADRVAPGVIVHAGCKLSGAALSVGPGCVLGAETPMTVVNCQLGHGVALKGGYAEGATFLDGANVGSGAHIRPGTLLEEEANAAHTVGLKQTILLPYVTLGSLINFCDLLMAGGTNRKNHSEVGSSYIHFNYTPHQDKATPSLLGDVPRGVLLDQPAIFLGGQGGLVGPSRIGFGCVIPAGIVWRGDAPAEGQLLAPEQKPVGRSVAFQCGAYKSIARIVRNNLLYIGNLRALEQWYRHARRPLMNRDAWALACLEGALLRLRECLAERIKRLGELAARMPRSLELARQSGGGAAIWVVEQERLQERWPALETALKQPPVDEVGAEERSHVVGALLKTMGGSFVEAVRALPLEARRNGSAWLQKIVEQSTTLWDN